MFLLKDKLRQVLSKKHLSSNVIGTICVNAVRHYFGFTHNDLLIDWYVKFNKLFLTTTQQHIKINVFKEKQDIILAINQSLSNVWYKNQIKDIFFK